MKLQRVLFWVLMGLVGVGAFVALRFSGAQESQVVRAGGSDDARSFPVPLTVRGLADEPESVDLAPVALDLGKWGKDEDGRRVWLGEALEYEIRWQGLPAGRALLRVKARQGLPDEQGPEIWLVRLDVRSNRFLSPFFPVDGKTLSRIDVKGGFSRQYSKDMEEGPCRSKERVSLDYALDRMEAVYEYPALHRLAVADRMKEKPPWRRVPIPLSGKVLDPLSAVYYLRGLRLEPGQVVVLPVAADRRVWNTRVCVEARETLALPSGEGSIECLRLRPECHYNGLFERRGPVLVWVDARTKVVIRLSAETVMGDCEAWLDRHSGSPLD